MRRIQNIRGGEIQLRTIRNLLNTRLTSSEFGNDLRRRAVTRERSRTLCMSCLRSKNRLFHFICLRPLRMTCQILSGALTCPISRWMSCIRLPCTILRQAMCVLSVVWNLTSLSLKFHSLRNQMSLTTGNPNLDEFMESYLSFMKNLSDRLDELTGAFSQLAQQIDETFQNM